MSDERERIERWLFEEFTSGAASVFEMMAGARPEAAWEPANRMPDAPGVRWRQPFPPLPGEMAVVAGEADANTAGNHILLAAGVEDGSPEDQRSTYLEILGQSLGAAAQSLTKRLGREVTTAGGAESADLPGEAVWGCIKLKLGESPVQLFVGIEPALIDALEEVERAPAPQARTEAPKPAAAAPQEIARAASAPAGRDVSPALEAAGESKTFDLLLDVELPVNVSFGKAKVPLKEVLKLSTGSIVELDRAVAEPVDVVVNNCVIARGEVVVVEGNFGVRIQEVMSRNDRIRSFQ